VKPAPERGICGLCGAAFVLVRPPGEDETERDKLCAECLTRRRQRIGAGIDAGRS